MSALLCCHKEFAFHRSHPSYLYYPDAKLLATSMSTGANDNVQAPDATRQSPTQILIKD